MKLSLRPLRNLLPKRRVKTSTAGYQWVETTTQAPLSPPVTEKIPKKEPSSPAGSPPPVVAEELVLKDGKLQRQKGSS